MNTIARTSGIVRIHRFGDDFTLSNWDLQALEANFDGWKKERAPSLKTWEAFERFTAEDILRDTPASPGTGLFRPPVA